MFKSLSSLAFSFSLRSLFHRDRDQWPEPILFDPPCATNPQDTVSNRRCNSLIAK